MTAYSNHCSASISFLAFLATMMVQIWKMIIPIMKTIKTTRIPTASPPAPYALTSALAWAIAITPKTVKMAYPIHERMAKTIQTRMAVLLRVWAPKIRTQCIITPIIPLIIRHLKNKFSQISENFFKIENFFQNFLIFWKIFKKLKIFYAVNLDQKIKNSENSDFRQNLQGGSTWRSNF